MPKRDVVVVDGSNIAFEEQSNGGKPRLANIIAVSKAIEDRGYEPIVIVDAALRHKIDDPDQLEAMIEAKKVRQAPAGTDADFFVLETAEQLDAQVVSNDVYKPYQEKYPWIMQRRIPLMIIKGAVEFYDHLLEPRRQPS
jgi:hypothetical protein